MTTVSRFPLTFAPVLPPFPFPEKWLFVDKLQKETSVKKWLVPNFIKNDNEVIKEESTKADSSEIGLVDDSSTAFDRIELNEFWAARFSKTIKRMKQKVHKSKRKAAWTSKR